MKVLNNNCRNDISDQECYHCSINGHITECPEKCEQFEPVMSQELMDHYKALSEHYNNEASRIVMEAYMLGRRDVQKKRDNKVSDLIRRQDVLKICNKYNGQGWVWSMIRKEVEELLPVNPTKTGHWRAVYQGDEIINYRCSECELGDTNGSTNLYGWDYCRRCGAKMVEPQESER